MNMDDIPTPFQRMQHAKGVMNRCSGCGRNVLPEWSHDDYCDGCKRDDYLADHLDYETEDYHDDED